MTDWLVAIDAYRLRRANLRSLYLCDYSLDSRETDTILRLRLHWLFSCWMVAWEQSGTVPALAEYRRRELNSPAFFQVETIYRLNTF